jgi:hypothetical protein
MQDAQNVAISSEYRSVPISILVESASEAQGPHRLPKPSLSLKGGMPGLYLWPCQYFLDFEKPWQCRLSSSDFAPS